MPRFFWTYALIAFVLTVKALKPREQLAAGLLLALLLVTVEDLRTRTYFPLGSFKIEDNSLLNYIAEDNSVHHHHESRWQEEKKYRRNVSCHRSLRLMTLKMGGLSGLILLLCFITSSSSVNYLDIPDFVNTDVKFKSAPFDVFETGPVLPRPLNELQYHGTTTLAFLFGDGVIVAVDSKASVGSYVGSRTVRKVFPISNWMVATMAGGAADCAFWIRRTARQAKVLEYEHGSPLKVRSVAKLLAASLREYRGSELSVGTMVAGYDQQISQASCEFQLSLC